MSNKKAIFSLIIEILAIFIIIACVVTLAFLFLLAKEDFPIKDIHPTFISTDILYVVIIFNIMAWLYFRKYTDGIKRKIYGFMEKHFPSNKQSNLIFETRLQKRLKKVVATPDAAPNAKLLFFKTEAGNKTKGLDASSLRSASQNLNGTSVFYEIYFDVLFEEVKETGERFEGELELIRELKNALDYLAAKQAKKYKRKGHLTFSFNGSRSFGKISRGRSHFNRMVSGENKDVERALRFKDLIPGYAIETLR